ncbi:helix-turn-helix domain-containing protein [Myceligenerans pegani]|uniref:Helix-turn-helix transcriptional regulator n=1 Tax=Myceligenerans pegani TaxID=2776917 RepID=A0ABR9MXK7_9MICO|nr:helix-turn-helix transcriptional regulator [Myceligenerans sp. TRM 65318]MBE1876121.1 helix-turn-helix transcriptional regulator [Myceligenerans sp. TRM 65318]MBE3018392.1 helix-turn-helix transcriptional regulator [Myceligenerans sp. TRM 65318]
MADERDTHIGKNLAAHRGVRSQTELARAMRNRGWKWSQSTVWAIEKGDRPIKLAEAVDLADELHVRIADLTREPELADADRQVVYHVRRIEVLTDRVSQALFDLERERQDLEDALDHASTIPGWDHVANTAAIGTALHRDFHVLINIAQARATSERANPRHADEPTTVPNPTSGYTGFSPDQWRAERDIPTPEPAVEHQPNNQEGSPHGIDQEAP